MRDLVGLFLAATVSAVLLAPTAHVVDNAARCEAAKVKTMGGYVACQTNAQASASRAGVPVDPADTAKCAGRLYASWGRAESHEI